MANHRGRTRALLLLAGAAFLQASSGLAQTNTGGGEAWIIANRDLDRYAAMYGDPQWTPLEDVLDGNVPLSGAIRTRGILEAAPRQRGVPRTYALRPLPGRRATVRARLPIAPGTLIRDSFDFEADGLNFREIEVVGTLQGAMGVDAGSGSGFWFWAYSAAPEGRSRASGTGLLAIEDLIARPANLAKETVRVRGQFRGKNLFGDVPGDGAPADGWVIKDGGYAVWVAGKRPRGDGWSLDPESRSDSARWLEVEGRIEKKDGLTLLRATKVALVPPPKAEAPE